MTITPPRNPPVPTDDGTPPPASRDGKGPPPLIGRDVPKRVPRQDFAVLALQMDRFTRAKIGHRDWALTAKTCVDFVEGRQWGEADLAALAEAGLPALTLNKVKPLVKLLKGYFRSNRYDIAYLPGADGGGSDEIAELLTRLSKHLDVVNQSGWADGHVFDDGITGGRGFLDSRLDFGRTVLGEIKETVLDPFAVFLDPEADSYDPNDWGWVQTHSWMSWEDLVHLYGQASAAEAGMLQETGIPVGTATGAEFFDDITPQRFFGQTDPTLTDLSAYGVDMSMLPLQDLVNRQRKLIRVIECQHRQRVLQNRFVDLQTGTFVTIPEHWDRNRIAQILAWAEGQGQALTVDKAWLPRVRVTVTAADRIVFDDWSIYRTFTVVPFFAEFRRGITTGLVHDLLDPQREVNKRRSALLHYVMTTANSGWMIEEDSVEEDVKEQLRASGAKPGVVVEYKAGRPKPERITPMMPPQALRLLEEAATSDIKEIAGINDAAMGQMDRVQSGRAIQARQRQSVLGAEVYFDNFARYQEIKGRKRVELIQDFYTEPRILRVRNPESGQSQDIQINWQTAAGEIENDVTLGTYLATVETSPVSDTFLEGVFDDAMTLRQQGVPIPSDVLVDLSTLPGKATLKERIAQAEQGQGPGPEAMELQLKAQGAQLKADTAARAAAIHAAAGIERARIAAAASETVAAINADAQGPAGPGQPVRQLQEQAAQAALQGQPPPDTRDLTAVIGGVIQALQGLINPPPNGAGGPPGAPPPGAAPPGG